MAVKIPWLLLCCAGVPLIMIYTKSKRMDAREIHEITMRVKYHSEYWQKGSAFAQRLQEKVGDSIVRAGAADPLRGREVAEITPAEWREAERRAAQAQAEEEARRSGGGSRRWFSIL